MAYSDYTSSFTTILNRDDCTSAQQQTFFNQASARIIRETQGRLYYLERTATFAPPSPNTQALQSATVSSGGSGYGASQTFNVTLSGGTSTTAAQASVSTDATGLVTKVNGVITAGVYTVIPSSPTATTGGTGTGLTLVPVFATAAFSLFAVPSDLLSIIDVLTNDQWGSLKPLKRLPHRQLLHKDPTFWPRWYSRFSGDIYVRGNVPLAQTVQLLYYGNFTALAVDGSGNYLTTSHNELTDNALDLVVYGALTFAADTFAHDSGPKWEARYGQILTGELEKTINLEFEGGPMEVQAAYGANDDDWTPNYLWGDESGA